MKLTVSVDQNFHVSDIERDETRPGWIEDYQNKHNQKLPRLLSYLLPLVNNYTEGEPISTDIKVIPVSGQKWQEMTSHQRNELLELVEFTSQDADDYCRLFQSMFPKTPSLSKRENG